jgi:hypothetical protein
LLALLVLLDEDLALLVELEALCVHLRTKGVQSRQTGLGEGGSQKEQQDEDQEGYGSRHVIALRRE